MSGSLYFEIVVFVKVRVEINEMNYVMKMFFVNIWNIGLFIINWNKGLDVGIKVWMYL